MSDYRPDAFDMILRAVATPTNRRADVAAAYAAALDLEDGASARWREVNLSIMDRWSAAALIWIKQRAWKLIEKGKP